MEEDGVTIVSAKVLPNHDDDDDDDDENGQENERSFDEEEDLSLLRDGRQDTLPLTTNHVLLPSSSSDIEEDIDEIPSTSRPFRVVDILHKNLLPDVGVVIGDFPLVEGEFTMKLLKFVLLTFASIAIVHELVKNFTDDRDRAMTLRTIWKYDTNLIISDCVVFFVVGRMWRQRGVDHLAWIIPMIVCNIYFECQTYFTWIRHSVSLFEIHCLWPW